MDQKLQMEIPDIFEETLESLTSFTILHTLSSTPHCYIHIAINYDILFVLSAAQVDVNKILRLPKICRSRTKH